MSTPASILIIEDDEAIATLVEEVLTGEGYAVIVARGGPEGVRAATEGMPDIILCDYRLPEHDGLDVLAQLRQHDALAETPFVFMTAYPELELRRNGVRLGIHGLLVKPFTENDLLTTVHELLRGT